ncbi:MAG: hypothetical protein AAGC70_20400 [Pseudomonadota bacterium]
MRYATVTTLAFAATLVTALQTPTFAADDRVCKSSKVTRTGGTAASELLARKRARDAWRQKVEEEYGKEYSAWYLAKNHDYSCFTQDGKNRCTAKATPCESAVVIQGPRKICNFYKINATGEASSSEFWAKHRARKKWSMRANMIVGDDFDTWVFANNRTVDCRDKSNGDTVCTAKATPCRLSLIN